MKKYLLLIISFLILSCSGACLKMASMQEFLSLAYIAYLSKSSTVGISLLYAYLLFGEQITIRNIIGCVLIIAGIMVLSYKKGQEA